MRAASGAVWLILVVTLAGADSPSPGTRLKALQRKYDEAQSAYQKALTAAKTDEDRQTIAQEKAPKLADHAAEFLKLARSYPLSSSAVDALVWVVTHPVQAIGPADANRKAALAILKRAHLKDDRVGRPCTVLAFSVDSDSEAFLRAVLAASPYRSVQVRACATLALNLKYRARLVEQFKAEAGSRKQHETSWGKAVVKSLMARDAKKMLAESAKLLERVRDKYGKIRHPTFGNHEELARWHLLAIRNPVKVDKLAPPTIGKDLQGKTLRMRDLKGKVVLLDFWGHSFPASRAMYAYERALVKRMKGKRFVLVGVCYDANTAELRKELEKEGNTWRSWTPSEAIAARWEVINWPTLFLIDHKGIVYDIHTGWPPTKDLDKQIDRLVKKAGK